MKPSPSSSVTVTVESLGGLGDGIATFEGKPLFIAKSCAGDVLNVRITHENRDGRHGVIEKIITPGPDRVTPPCDHFSQCGGCTLQHLSPSAYQHFKTQMLRQALAYGGFSDVPAEVTFLPAGTRRRVEFKRDANGRLAFHALRSHIPVTIELCPVLEPKLQALMAPLNAWLASLPCINEVQSISLTASDSGIDLLLELHSHTLPALSDMAEAVRIAVKLVDASLHIVHQKAPVEMQLGGYSVPLPPEAFLQATREGQQRLTDVAVEACADAKSVIDLFCGIGTYSFPLSSIAKVHAVEGDRAMVKALQNAAKQHKLSLTAEQRDLFKSPLTSPELARFDAAIINPPRLGAKAQVQQLARSGIPTIVMISCNPATFSRDARILKEAGFRLTKAQGIDQFVYSQHLEIAAVFRR